MIKSFKCKETQKIWEGFVSLRLARSMQDIARRKLRMLNNAKNITDLRAPPNSHLEALKGDRVGQYNIRINDQWRVCFQWQDGFAIDVIIEDYH